MDLASLVREAQEKNLHVLNVVVRQNGSITAEHNFAEEKRVLLWSVSKTFTSMAVGIAESEGFFRVTDPLSKYFRVPQTGFWNAMTIHDLLCMGTGQAKCPLTEAMNAGKPLDDVESLFFSEPVVHTPGTKFLYNNAATYMLSKLVSVTTGTHLNAFLAQRVYEPLGFQSVEWIADGNGIQFGCSGLHLTAHEIATFGQLLLDKGRWNGAQLIPAGYIERATRKQIDTSDYRTPFTTADHQSGYGYQLWMNNIEGTYRLDGLYGQYVVVIPQKKTVVAYTSNEPTNMVGILELTWNHILGQL